MTAAEVRALFEITEDQLNWLLDNGVPQNPDGTFRFWAVLAFAEKTLTELSKATGNRY